MRLELGFATVLFLLSVVVLLPVLAWLGYRRIRSGRPLGPLRRRLTATIVMLLGIAELAHFAALENHIQLSYRFTLLGCLLAIFYLGFLVFGARRNFKRKPEAVARQRRIFGSSTPFELALAIVAGICAGLAEEFAYRGVLFQMANRLLGSTFLAFVLVSAIFGLSHIVQGWRSAVVVGVLGLVFQALALISESLFAPTLLHILYDLAVFVMLYKRLAPATEPAESLSQSA